MTFPEVQLDLELGYAAVDIVSKGFDAGIRPREHAAANMIAVRVAEPTEVAVVGALSYFAVRSAPRVPEDLVQHGCVQYRWGSDRSTRKWAFECDGESRSLAVDGPLIVNGVDFAVLAAVDGVGIAYVPEALAAPFIRSGQLIRVLEKWCPRSEALFLHYFGRRQVPAALRALIDMLRTVLPAMVDTVSEVSRATALPAIAPFPRRTWANAVESAAQS